MYDDESNPLADGLYRALSSESIFALNNLEPDDWQGDLLNSASKRIAVCCSRQAGKTLTAAAIAIHFAANKPGVTVGIISPSQEQSGEILRRCIDLIEGAELRSEILKETQKFVQFKNKSRILALQGSREDTVRGLSLDLLILDEAAAISDEVFVAVSPMIAARKDARVIALSTPKGRRGWFFLVFHDDENGWQKIRVPATEIPRISHEELEMQRRVLGEIKFRQEFECDFSADGAALFSIEMLDKVFVRLGVLQHAF